MSDSELIPARMVNEFVYCPRLCHLEWVQGEFAHSAHTVEGGFVHRQVDQLKGELPGPDELPDGLEVRSLTLSSDRLGAIAKLDIARSENGKVTPVDFKRGKVPDVPNGAYDPERVQICLQGLILRDNGYACDEGAIFFHGSRRLVIVPLTDELIAQTEAAIIQAKVMAASPTPPPPLVDSPKCIGCSLVGICLPDEVNHLARQSDEPLARRLIPANDDALPVYVQVPGAFVSKQDETLVVKLDKAKVAQARLFETSQLCLFGHVQVSTQVIQELCRREIPICFFSAGGYFLGMTQGIGHKNVLLRWQQYRQAGDEASSLAIARRFVWGKIRNARTLLRRNAASNQEHTLAALKRMAEQALSADTMESLLGYEGNAARVYFAAFPDMIRARREGLGSFDFDGRNKRPPRDPVNAMLSFVYALLTKDLTVTAAAVGLDPYMGFYHQPRYGKPSLALDLCEEFRR